MDNAIMKVTRRLDKQQEHADKHISFNVYIIYTQNLNKLFIFYITDTFVFYYTKTIGNGFILYALYDSRKVGVESTWCLTFRSFKYSQSGSCEVLGFQVLESPNELLTA